MGSTARGRRWLIVTVIPARCWGTIDIPVIAAQFPSNGPITDFELCQIALSGSFLAHGGEISKSASITL